MTKTANVTEIFVRDDYIQDRLICNSVQDKFAVTYTNGGADSCMGRDSWKVEEYTGRKANLVGYDDRNTKKTGLDICTLTTKITPTDPNETAFIV